MGWQEDLAAWLGETDPEEALGAILRSAPAQAIGDTPVARGVGQALTSAPAQTVFNFMDAPLSGAKFGTGALIGGINEGLGLLPGQPGFDPEASYALHNGGPRAVWEQTLEDDPLWFKAPVEVALDPTTYLGFGLGRHAGEAARGAATIAAAADRPVLAGALGVGARGADAAQFLWNDAPDKLLGPPIRAAGRAARAGVEKVAPTAFEIAPRFKLRQEGDAIRNAVAEERSSLRGRGYIGQGMTRIPPITEVPTYPRSPEVAPRGSAPEMAEERAASVWDRLRSRRMGIVPALDDRPTKYQFRSPKDVDLTDQDLEDMAAVGVDVIRKMSDQGGVFNALLRASEGTRKIQKQLVREYGAGIQPYIPMIYSRMRQQLGDDADALMPSSRYLLPWGWSENAVNTRKVYALRTNIEKGKQSRAEALNSIRDYSRGSPGVIEAAAAQGAGMMSLFHQGDDELLAALQPGGVYFPTTPPGKPNAKAAIPRAFLEDAWNGTGPLKMDLSEAGKLWGVVSPFGDNREAWRSYMRAQFGQMDDDELDVLADMSAEMMYDDFLNAANPYSGGGQGHRKLAKAVTDGEIDKTKLQGRARKDTYSRDKTKLIRNKGDLIPLGEDKSKIGGYATEDWHIGSPRSQELIRSLDYPGSPVRYDSHGKINMEDLHIAQARRAFQEATGQELNLAQANQLTGSRKQSLDDKLAAKVLAALGERPIEPNPVGGLLPNLTQLIRKWDEGSGLTVGTGEASTWYPRAADEIAMIVGWDNYEDATMLLNLVGITSAATEVSVNAERALRILAEWKLGKDDTLRRDFGLSGDDVIDIMNGQMLVADLPGEQRKKITEAFNEFARRNNDPGRMPQDLQGGPKTHNYAGSFLVNLWRRALDRTPIADAAKKAFNDALSIYTVDRHDSRLHHLATAVTPLQAFTLRERNLLTAKELGVSGEAMQGAGWYWVRDSQGFMREVRPQSDLVVAMRDVLRREWDGKAGEGEWDALVSRMQSEGNLSYEDALSQTYDLARQELFYSLIAKSLKKPAVQEALRKAGIQPTLEGVKDDALGLLFRGYAGGQPEDWTDPIGNTQDVWDHLEAGSLEPISNQGGSWVSDTRPARVLRTSAPVANAPISRRRAWDTLMAQSDVAGLFDARRGAGYGDKLGFQIIPEGDQVRVALVAFTDQEVPGGTLPQKVRSLFGDPAAQPRTDAATFKRRGPTIAELDTVNPWSLWRRKVVEPIMDRYAELSLKAGVKAHAGMDIADLGLPEWPDEAVAKFGQLPSGADAWNPGISLPANQTLQRTLADGTSYRQYLHQRTRQFTEDLATLEKAGASWKPYTTVDERIASVVGAPNAREAQKVIRRWHEEGVDPLHVGDASEAAITALEWQLAKDAGIKMDAGGWWNLFTAAWGEQALFSLKYPFGNMQGNWIQAALGGTFMAPTPSEFVNGFLANRQGIEEVTRTEALNSLKMTQVANRWGLERPPVEVMRGGIRNITSNTARTSPSAVGELAGRLTRNPSVGRKVGWIFQVNNDFSQALDGLAKGAVWSDVLDREMRLMIPAWEAEVRRQAAGIPDFEFSLLEGINVPEGGPFFQPLRAKLTELGIPAGKAERLAQDFNGIRNKANAAATKEMKRRLFSYDRTNLDEWIGRFVPFHYWFSRALRYYGEEVLRHPFLAVNYMRANDGIEDAQNDPGLSARQKGFLRLFGTPLGFSVLMNPDALFGVVKVFNMDGSYEPDGQTELGGAINWLKERGLGLYPWIDGTLNLMGMYGNTFEPDLLGIRHKSLVGAAINFARAHTGFEPAGAPYADAMGQLRYATSSFVSSFTPDWVSQPVTPKAGNSTQEASLDTIIESIIVANNPNLTNGELLEIMTEPEHPEYQRAFQAAAEAGLVQQLLNFIIPQQFRVRHDARDVRASQVQVIEEAARKSGVSPYEFAPSPQDLSFAAKYEQMTGRKWRPADYENAKIRHDLVRAPDEHKQFIVDAFQWQKLGNPKQRQDFDTYVALLYGTDNRTAGMSQPARQEAARIWADKHGSMANVENVYALRDAFQVSHPEFAEFKEWQDRVRGIGDSYGGLAEYRRRVMAENPNAARYFADRWVWIQATFPQGEWASRLDDETVSATAYQAITGKGSDNRQLPGATPGYPAGDMTALAMQAAGDNGRGGTNWALEAARTGWNMGLDPIGFK